MSLSGEIIYEGTLWLYSRKAYSETIMGSLRFMKCVLSFISFVNMPLVCMIPGTCLTYTSFDWWNLRTIFYLRFKCLMPFEVTEASYWTAALLSLYILVLEHASVMSISLERWSRNRSLVVHSLVAIISASQELGDVWFWRIYFHAIGPP